MAMRPATVVDHPVLECTGCHAEFDAELPMTRRAFASSRLMFLVEHCPSCGEMRTYLRSAYRFEPSMRLLTA